MSISFEGFDNKLLTFETSTAIEAGTPVKLTGSGTVAAADDGENFIGIAVSCRDGIAGVIVRGTVQVDCSDVSIDCGYNKLTSAGGTEVRADDDGILMTVLEIDSNANKATILL